MADDYKTECPDCGGKDLRVIEVTLCESGKTLKGMNVPLMGDGFQFDPNDPDIKDCSTEDEKVQCKDCGNVFNLADLINE